MKQTMVWLSFDLGTPGDYQGMYEFLDERGAKECGDGIGVFPFLHEGGLDSELSDALRKAVKINRRSRVYIVTGADDGKARGRFLFGGRKPSPWTGYHAVQTDEQEVDE
ncbi:MAG: hypothetical protein ACRC1K_00705 [Planctomycetia bacterium]